MERLTFGKVADDGSEDALRFGFRCLGRAAGRGTARRRTGRHEPAARLGEPGEEIDCLARSDRCQLRSQIYRIVRHLAKLQFHPASDPRRGWWDSVVDGRMEADLVLADSPSLKTELDRVVSQQIPKALGRAIFDLGEYGEVDPATELAIRCTRYTAEQVLGDWFPPDRMRTSVNGEQGR